jgi:hypothetical protein
MVDPLEEIWLQEPETPWYDMQAIDLQATQTL